VGVAEEGDHMNASPDNHIRAACGPSLRLWAGAAAAILLTGAAGTASAHLAQIQPQARAPAATPASAAVQQQAAVEPSYANVVLTCVVADQGAVKDCSIVSEDPAGSGYGAAALQMASQFHLALKADGGVAVPGERMTIPVRIHISN
jgi:hypothetical protein